MAETSITVTKKQLVDRISELTGETKATTRQMVQIFLDAIVAELSRGHRIELRDFGVFEVRERAPRIGRNPRTGEQVRVPPRRVVSFKVGRQMKKRVAGS